MQLTRVTCELQRLFGNTWVIPIVMSIAGLMSWMEVIAPIRNKLHCFKKLLSQKNKEIEAKVLQNNKSWLTKLWCKKPLVHLLNTNLFLPRQLWLLTLILIAGIPDQEGAERNKGWGYSSRKYVQEIPHLWFDFTSNTRVGVRITVRFSLLL